MRITKDDKTALLFGATGLVGGHLLEMLLLHPAYARVVAFSRKEIAISHEKLTTHVIDFSKIETFQDLIIGDDLFCALGTTIEKAGSKENFFKVDFVYALSIAKAAAANQVNQFLLVSAVGANPDSIFFYNRVKGQLEAAITKEKFWAFHIFRPSILLGKRNENRWGENLARRLGKGLNTISGGLLDKYAPVEAATVAKVMINAAQQIKKGKHIYSSEQFNQ